jgi:beta-lactamase class D
VKRFVPPLFTLFVAASAQAAEWIEVPSWRRHFEARDLEGTFVLFEPYENRWRVLDLPRARRGFLPASTFEIASALIGLETGALADENEVFRWDGSPRPCAAWERDHALDSGMRESVVWMFQEVARRIGKARLREGLALFDYGNRDIAGGIDLFWLQGALRISAVQQVEFLRKLEEGRLPVGARSRRLVRESLVVERTPAFTLRAKTGTARRSEGAVGWWVGWVEKGGHPVAYFAMNDSPPVSAAREDRFLVSRAILREAGVL